MNSNQALRTDYDVQPVINLSDTTLKQTCFCSFSSCSAQNLMTANSCQDCGRPLLLQGRYRAVRNISQGRYAKTYEAIDQVDERLCVIKQFLLTPEDIEPNRWQLAQNLFQQEALILQRLGHHPQIPSLIAFFEAEHTLFLIQEFVPGQSLYQKIKQSPAFQSVEIQAILENLLPVLDFIHSHDIIHRDIKLGNIIHATSGPLWLIDFGAAYHKNLGRLGIAGTLGYAAPEQLQGQSFPGSDLYSLAVTCVSLLTGNILDTTESGFHSPDEFLRCLWENAGPTLPPELALILERMLQPDLASRYQAAADVLKDLQALKSPTLTVDYGRLQFLLANEAYQEANQETGQILLQLSDRLPHGMLTVDAIERISFTDLRILDQLWSVASGGRFGFGVQLRLYQHQGTIRDFNYERWQSFAEQVGWCDQGQWAASDALRFSAESPPGHLPAVYFCLDQNQRQRSGPLGWWRLGFMSLMERFSLS